MTQPARRRPQRPLRNLKVETTEPRTAFPALPEGEGKEVRRRAFEFEPLPVGRNESGVSDVTYLLHAAEHSDAHAAADLLPLVYEELRRIAAHKMSQ